MCHTRILPVNHYDATEKCAVYYNNFDEAVAELKAAPKEE